MRSWIDTVSLAGPTLRVSAPAPLPANRDALVVTSAIRVFERFPALERFVLVAGDEEASLARAEVERLLGPAGWAALEDRGRWAETLARALERHARGGAGADR